ncbi:unnamed protein product [Timema podura]|uniref:Partial AB-hydrolase lipase domain-containing protein n=1 Tax=Timema podura TaxID=61482 RepID=A0ABN7PP20_TIMPD|nr:unnamed protein product [Timema podura]
MGRLLTCLQLVAWSCLIVDARRRFSLGSARGAELWSQNQIETSDVQRLPSESYMNTVQLVKKEGYPVEEHQVTTQDGYQLTLHRIPSWNKNAPVVHLQHGFLGASDFWVITPRDKSLVSGAKSPIGRFLRWGAPTGVLGRSGDYWIQSAVGQPAGQGIRVVVYTGRTN